MATRSLIQIAQAVAYRLGAYENGTATGGSTTTLTSAASPFKTSLTNANSNKYVGDEIRPSSGAESGNQKVVVTYAPTTGIFTVDSAWSTGPSNADTFDIFRRGITYSMLSTAINRALRKMRYTSIVPLSMLADADCDESDATSWGTAVSATATKVTAAGNVLRGARALRVLNSAANGYLPTAQHKVRYSQSFYVQANVRADVGTAKLIAWDSTNGVEIGNNTYDHRGWGRISFTFNTPTTCELLTLRLSGVGASDDVYWDDVMLYPLDSTEIALPSYITAPGQVQRVYADVARSYSDQDVYKDYHWWEVAADESNPNNQFKLRLWPGIQDALWLQVARPPTALSAATDTCFLDRDWVEIASVCELLDMLINQRSPGAEATAWKIELGRRQKELVQLSHKFMPKPVLRTGFATPPNTPVRVV